MPASTEPEGQGATHLSFMDVPFLPLGRASRRPRAMLAATQIAPQRMWRITSDLLLSFFATQPRQAGIPSVLAGPSDDYPELSFGPP